MKTNYKNNIITDNKNRVLKTTALAYLGEALYKEDYEACTELLTLAKEFGARREEIKATIAIYAGVYGEIKIRLGNLGIGGRMKRL